MSTEKSEAIVLRAIAWSETSLIVTLYTQDLGKVAAVAKGARRPKSPFDNALDLLSTCRVVCILKSSDSLDLLTEAKLIRRFRVARSTILHLNCGYYVIELLDRLTERGEKQPELYALAKDTIDALQCVDSNPAAVVLRFELQLLRMLGQAPLLTRCANCGRSMLDSGVQVGAMPANGWSYFSNSAGGVVCDNCRANVRNTIRLSKSALRCLAAFSDSNWRAIPLNTLVQEDKLEAGRNSLNGDDRAAIRSTMQKYFTSLLERPPNLYSFLEELRR